MIEFNLKQTFRKSYDIGNIVTITPTKIIKRESKIYLLFDDGSEIEILQNKKKGSN